MSFAARRAVWVVLAAIVATALGLRYAASNLRVDTNRDKMISRELPFKREQARVDALFPRLADNLVIVIDAPSPEAARAAALELAAGLRERSDLFTGVEVPRADPFLERHGLLFLTPDELAELIDRLAEVQPFLGRLGRDPSLRGLFGMLADAYEEKAGGRAVELGATPKRIASALSGFRAGRPAPISWQELLGGEEIDLAQRRQFVLTDPVLDYGRLLPVKDAMEAIARLAEPLKSEHGARVRITGGLAMAHEELGTVMQGAGKIAALVFVMVGAVLFAALRSWRLVLAVIVTLLVGLSLTAAFAMLAVGHLNLISVVFAALYLGLGVDYAIHLCLRYRELAREGAAREAALSAAARDVGGSLALCALTTAIGFYAFVPTAYSGVSELGLISGTGMFISLIVSLTLLPALIELFRTPAPRAPRRAPKPRAWLDFPLVHRGAVLACTAGLAVAALSLAPATRFDPNPLNLRDPDSESVATFRDLLASSESSPWSLRVMATGAEAEGAARERLAALSGVARVVSPSSFIPSEQDEKLELLDEASLLLGGELVPDIREAAPSDGARLAAIGELRTALGHWLASDAGAADEGARALDVELGAIENSARSEPLESIEHTLTATLSQNLERLDALLGADPISAANLPASVTASWIAADGTRRVEAFPRDDLHEPAAMRAFVDEVLSVAPEATGTPRTLLASGDAVVTAFGQALLYALLVIGLIVLVILGSLRDAFFVLTPLLLAAALAGATLVALGIAFDFANVIALPLLLGIGVDSSIHVVHRARHSGSRRINPLRTSTAPAVLFSALTTLASFVNLSLSAHPGTARMGLALSVGIAWTLVATLVVLPALLAPRAGATDDA